MGSCRVRNKERKKGVLTRMSMPSEGIPTTSWDIHSPIRLIRQLVPPCIMMLLPIVRPACTVDLELHT